MDHENWIDLAVAACEDAGIGHSTVEVVTSWDEKFVDSDSYRNNAVFRIGDQRCLKLYGPTSDRRFHAGRSVLRMLVEHDYGVPAPHFVAARERSRLPPYLIMTEIPGSTVEDTWESLTRSEQLIIAREIGTITASIHNLPQEGLAEVGQQFGDRNKYIRLMQAERIAQIEATEALSMRFNSLMNHRY